MLLNHQRIVYSSKNYQRLVSNFRSQDRIRTCTMRCVFLSGLLLLIYPSWLPTLVTNLRIPIRNLTKNVCFLIIPRTHKLCRHTIRRASTSIWMYPKVFFISTHICNLYLRSLPSAWQRASFAVRIGFEPIIYHLHMERFLIRHLTIINGYCYWFISLLWDPFLFLTVTIL